MKGKKKTMKFKTTLNCGGCVKKVTPHLDAITQVEEWNVDLDNVNKVLKVKTASDHADEVAGLVQQALQKEGYEAELLN